MREEAVNIFLKKIACSRLYYQMKINMSIPTIHMEK